MAKSEDYSIQFGILHKLLHPYTLLHFDKYEYLQGILKQYDDFLKHVKDGVRLAPTYEMNMPTHICSVYHYDLTRFADEVPKDLYVSNPRMYLIHGFVPVFLELLIQYLGSGGLLENVHNTTAREKTVFGDPQPKVFRAKGDKEIKQNIANTAESFKATTTQEQLERRKTEWQQLLAPVSKGDMFDTTAKAAAILPVATAGMISAIAAAVGGYRGSRSEAAIAFRKELQDWFSRIQKKTNKIGLLLSCADVIDAVNTEEGEVRKLLALPQRYFEDVLKPLSEELQGDHYNNLDIDQEWFVDFFEAETVKAHAEFREALQQAFHKIQTIKNINGSLSRADVIDAVTEEGEVRQLLGLSTENRIPPEYFDGVFDALNTRFTRARDDREIEEDKFVDFFEDAVNVMVAAHAAREAAGPHAIRGVWGTNEVEYSREAKDKYNYRFALKVPKDAPLSVLFKNNEYLRPLRKNSSFNSEKPEEILVFTVKKNGFYKQEKKTTEKQSVDTREDVNMLELLLKEAKTAVEQSPSYLNPGGLDYFSETNRNIDYKTIINLELRFIEHLNKSIEEIHTLAQSLCEKCINIEVLSGIHMNMVQQHIGPMLRDLEVVWLTEGGTFNDSLYYDFAFSGLHSKTVTEFLKFIHTRSIRVEHLGLRAIDNFDDNTIEIPLPGTSLDLGLNYHLPFQYIRKKQKLFLDGCGLYSESQLCDIFWYNPNLTYLDLTSNIIGSNTQPLIDWLHQDPAEKKTLILKHCRVNSFPVSDGKHELVGLDDAIPGLDNNTARQLTY